MPKITLVKTLSRSTPTAIDKLLTFVFGDSVPAPYDENTEYAIGDYMYMIDENGVITFYQCIIPTTGPFNPDHWKVMTVIDSIGSGTVISEVEPTDPNISTWYRPITYSYGDVDAIIAEMNPARFDYTVDDSGVTITGILPDMNIFNDVANEQRMTFSIPKTIEGVTVVSVGPNAFIGARGISHLVIPDNVQSVINGAFAVTEVAGTEAHDQCCFDNITFGYGLSEISAYAFSNQTKITTLDFPGTIDSIVTHAFNQCTSLTSITIRNREAIISSDAFIDCTSLTDVYGYPGSTAEEFATAKSLTFHELT